ncbi:gluconokinase [uncultured Selenomonas sp.]|uniref:gluconokinase n=1 Tax=uncultured Selenomonas sp. TaxID=159275 RepID=UPI0025DF4FBE|nr:gluconokinase [uncultured Selenomonas sp.]
MKNHHGQVEAWIGVDVGTTGVRAIAYSIDGEKLASSEAFYPLLTPHTDWAEENPLEIYESVEKVIRETAATLRYRNGIATGIALSTVMHSFAPLDEHRRPMTNMITWADSRSADIVREMQQDAALAKRFYEKTGCPVHTCYPLAKILWLRKHLPERFAQMHYVGSLKDYLFEKLTGVFAIDHSAASTSGLYNEADMDWDAEILSYAGITRDMLPPIVSGTHAESLTAEAAEATGLPAGLPVVIGATDGVLVNVGIGAVEPGQLSATIGTSGALRMLTNRPMTDPKGRTWCYNLVDDIWVAGGAINNGGMILRWGRDRICHYTKAHLENLDVDGYDLMTMKAAHVPAGAGGLIMLPCFTGERSPYWNSELRGMILGLTLNHSRSHIIRAAMEGICYSMNAVMKALEGFGEVKDIRVSGSFTKSTLWLQILSDVLGRELTLPENSEGAAFGAAVLGFISTGRLSSIRETAGLVKAKRRYTPIPENEAVYQQLFSIFEKLYWMNQETFAAITSFQQEHPVTKL